MRRVLIFIVAAGLVFALVSGVAPATPTAWTHETNITTGMPNYPVGVATDKFGNTYVVSSQPGYEYVYRYGPYGAYLGTWGDGLGSGNGELDAPRDVDVDRWGNVFVADAGNYRVAMFNPGGLWTRSISQPGSDPEDLTNPNGVAVSNDGFVYVSDNTFDIRKFDSYGAHIGNWTTDGAAIGISCDEDGFVWVANDQATGPRPLYGNSIIKYSPAGVMLDSWGGTGTDPGEFNRLYDVEVDPSGLVYAIESQGARAQVFTGDGGHVATFGSNGVGDANFNGPYGLDAGPDRTVDVADTWNHRLSQWSPSTAIETGDRRVYGTNRYATAARASRVGYPTGANFVVVATGTNWPDALGGSALCGAVGGPLLLTDPDVLSGEAAAEIDRLGAEQAYLLGSPDAVSPAVYDALEVLVGAGDVTRLGGTDRYKTAIRIAQEVSALVGAFPTTAFVVTGEDFPDALAASPIAAANKWPIFLTPQDDLPTNVKNAMAGIVANHGYVVGGEASVSADVLAELNSPPFVGFSRYSGSNRYSTAAKVARIGYTGMGMLTSRPALATGEDFPDALAGGVLQGSDYNVMLLTPSSSLHPSAANYLDRYQDFIYEMRFLGGTSSVSAAVRTSAMARLH